MSESDEQVILVKWFAMQYPKYKDCLISYPSGFVAGGKNKFALIAKLKREGWKKGVSDLFLAVPRGEYHGFWLELKDKGKTQCVVSPEQNEHIELMIDMGYLTGWTAGADNAIKMITDYMQLKQQREG